MRTGVKGQWFISQLSGDASPTTVQKWLHTHLVHLVSVCVYFAILSQKTLCHKSSSEAWVNTVCERGSPRDLNCIIFWSKTLDLMFTCVWLRSAMIKKGITITKTHPDESTSSSQALQSNTLASGDALPGLSHAARHRLRKCVGGSWKLVRT